MALTGEAAIADALFWHLSQLVLDSPLRIALPGIVFPGPGEEKPPAYLEASFQPNRPPPSPIPWDAPASAQGLMQVSVHWPEGEGIVKPTAIGTEIAAHFARGTEILRRGIRVRIAQDPWVSGALREDGGRFLVPVTVPWVVL